MPLDLNTSIDFLKSRVDATLAVQSEIAASWVWPLKSLASWQEDSLQLDKSQENTIAARAIDAATRAESARGQLDARMSKLHLDTKTITGVMRVRAKRSEDLADVVDELSARGDSRRAIEDEAANLLSAWKEGFGGDAFQPTPDVSFSGFRALLFGDDTAVPPISSLRTLKQALSDAATVERSRTASLNSLLNRAERDAQDWYAEATSVFAEGTPIGDLIRTLPTTTTYNPGTPTPATPDA